ncbi:hypothetical protein NY78_1402 [Desulfovibrio sp. TomC]|nr:hypothetical protein NY78_1402 [Desulfovibrio sp. TomC]
MSGHQRPVLATQQFRDLGRDGTHPIGDITLFKSRRKLHKRPKHVLPQCLIRP